MSAEMSTQRPPADEVRDRHAADVRRAYVSAQRARLYSALTALVGTVLIVAVFGWRDDDERILGGGVGGIAMTLIAGLIRNMTAK